MAPFLLHWSWKHMLDGREYEMYARIYKPARNAMQSGTAKTKSWVLEFAPASARELDPLMGWTGSADTQSQVKMRFETLEDAKSYAKANGLAVTVQQHHTRKPNIRKGGYGENFAPNRRQVWTH
jgi:hypothetical protein